MAEGNLNDEQHATYISWLRNAHAMELGLLTMLETQASETEDHPDIQKRIKEHLRETKRHATTVEAALKRHGEDISGGKDALSQLSSAINGMLHSLPDDSLVKNAMSSYAAEHFEISSYTALIAAAEELDDEVCVSAFEGILKEEIAMANWLAKQLPDIVKEYISSLE